MKVRNKFRRKTKHVCNVPMRSEKELLSKSGGKFISLIKAIYNKKETLHFSIRFRNKIIVIFKGFEKAEA